MPYRRSLSLIKRSSQKLNVATIGDTSSPNVNPTKKLGKRVSSGKGKRGPQTNKWLANRMKELNLAYILEQVNSRWNRLGMKQGREPIVHGMDP